MFLRQFTRLIELFKQDEQSWTLCSRHRCSNTVEAGGQFLFVGATGGTFSHLTSTSVFQDANPCSTFLLITIINELFSYFSPLNEHVERHLCVLWSFCLLTFVPPTTGSITHHHSPRTLMDTLTGRLVSAFVYDRFQENVPFVQCKCISLWLSHKSEVNSVWFFPQRQEQDQSCYLS